MSKQIICVFFQAEDGRRDVAVTGVQTCALPICDSDVGCGMLDVYVVYKIMRLGCVFGLKERERERER